MRGRLEAHMAHLPEVPGPPPGVDASAIGKDGGALELPSPVLDAEPMPRHDSDRPATVLAMQVKRMRRTGKRDAIQRVSILVSGKEGAEGARRDGDRRVNVVLMKDDRYCCNGMGSTIINLTW